MILVPRTILRMNERTSTNEALNNMTMPKALHPKDDKDRQYVTRKEGGREFANIHDSVDVSIQRLEDYI